MGNIRFSGALEALKKQGEKIAVKHSTNTAFVKLMDTQEMITSKTDALVSLAEAKKESPSDLLKMAEKLYTEFSESKKKIVNEILLEQATLEVNLYRLSGLTTDYTTRPYSQEIRTVVRSMQPVERMKFLQDAIVEKDLNILSATLHAGVPVALTGFDEKTRTELRTQFFENVLPEYMRTVDDFKELSDVIETSLGVGLDATTTYSDPRRLAEIRNTEVRAETARKLLSAD